MCFPKSIKESSFLEKSFIFFLIASFTCRWLLVCLVLWGNAVLKFTLMSAWKYPVNNFCVLMWVYSSSSENPVDVFFFVSSWDTNYYTVSGSWSVCCFCCWLPLILFACCRWINWSSLARSWSFIISISELM